jgi:ABC-2 type transport system permease protein
MASLRLVSIIRKEFTQIWRDPRTLALIIVMPIMQLLLMGYAATTNVRNVPMAVFDQDRSRESRALLESFLAADYFKVNRYTTSLDDLLDSIHSGESRVGLIIPPDFGNALVSKESAKIALVLDGSDPTSASSSLSAAQLISQEHATQILVERLERTAPNLSLDSPIEMRTQVWYNPDMISAYYMVPGVIGMILYAIASILTATAIVRERERGTIEQLIVTPIRSWELVVGKLLPYVLLTLMNTIEVLAIGSLLFGVPIRGDLTTILLLSSLFLLTGLGIGLLMSTIANTQQEAMLAAFMTVLPAIYLSGFFFPLEAMPRVLQWISHLTPLRYYLIIIRSVMIKGVGMAALKEEILALALFGVGIMALAAMRMRKRLD